MYYAIAVGLLAASAVAVPSLGWWRAHDKAAALQSRINALDTQVKAQAAQERINKIEREAAAKAAGKLRDKAAAVLAATPTPGATDCEATVELVQRRLRGEL